MKRIKLQDRILPAYSNGEEIFNAISHGTGIILGMLVCLFCCIKTLGQGFSFAGSLIYGISMIVLYTFSTLYHSFPRNTAKKVFQILDHCTIYILIAGTYTPILVTAFIPEKPVIGWSLLSLQWCVSVVAITLNAIDLHRYRYFSYAAYLILGWAIVVVAPIALKIMHPLALWYLLLGGISYTVGAITFVIGIKRKYYHSIFHIFVLLGSFVHFLGIYIYIL